MLTELIVVLSTFSVEPPPEPATPAGAWVERTIDTDKGPRRHYVYTPPGHEGGGPWPMILFLHGSGESGDDPEAVTKVGIGPAVRANPERWPCVIVFPQKPRMDHEWWEYEKLALDAADDAIASFNVDEDRVTLTGLSQGGAGTWILAARHNDRWRAAAPVCGYGLPFTIVNRLGSLPIWAFHGEADNVVEASQTVRMIDALKRVRAGKSDAGEVRMTLYPGVGHNSWDQAYATEELARFLVITAAPTLHTP